LLFSSDPVFNKIKNEYSLVSKALSGIINSILIFKANATFGEYMLNYINLDISGGIPINKTNKKFALIFLNYILPLAFEVLYRLFKDKFSHFKSIYEKVRLINAYIDISYKFKYIFDGKFLHSSFIEHILRIMIVNQGSKAVLSDKFLNIGKQLNLFFLFTAMRLGEWYYSKDKAGEEGVLNIPPPKKKINNNSCVICKNEITEPVALKCCGIVICEKCINGYMKNKDKCPDCETLLSPTLLVKIFL
jgi:hypothetical protein